MNVPDWIWTALAAASIYYVAIPLIGFALLVVAVVGWLICAVCEK